MTTVFGAVADEYDDARPGYPPWLGPSLLSFCGSPPSTIVEIGAGTGKGTAILIGLGASSLECIEPDPSMASRLRSRFPSVSVYAGSFESWTPPEGGVDLVACAMAWHWLDPSSRCQRAFSALRPGGTLAVFGHRYACLDPAMLALGRSWSQRPDGWFREDIEASGLFEDVTLELIGHHASLSRERYLRLVRTLSPVIRKAPEERDRDLAAIAAVLGETVPLDLRTALVLARRPG